MQFEIIGAIRNVETIARGKGIRDLKRLCKQYGLGNWRKRKGFATVQLDSGAVHSAEIHWYEATGIGRKEFKIKRFLD